MQFYWVVHFYIILLKKLFNFYSSLGGAFLHNTSSSFFSAKYVVQLRTSLAKCHRRDLIIRGSDTNNYVEAQLLVLKDTILR